MKKLSSILLAAALAFGLLVVFPPTASAAVNVPIGVAATAGIHGVVVSWTDNSDDEIGFYIYRAEGSLSAVRIGSTPANVPAFLDTTAVGGKTYTYSVSARINEEDDTARSAGFTLTMPGGKPLAPTNLSANYDFVDYSGVFLIWKDNSSIEERFTVYRRVAVTTSWTSVGITPPNTETFLDDTVAAGTTYEYMVQAFLSPNYSDQSNVVTVTTPPAAPTGLTATAGAGGVTLNWTNNAPTATFFMVVRKEAGGSFVGIYSEFAAVTTWVDTTAQEGKTYTYMVRVYASGGGGYYSAYSNEATATMRPLAPTDLTATADAGGITLNWTNHSTTATGIQIQREHEGSGFYLVTTVSATATTYLDAAVEEGKTYTYRVVAIAAPGVGGFSGQATATMPLPVYTVTFRYSNGQPDWKQTVDKGEKADYPKDPVQKGFVFAGWFEDEKLELAYDFDIPVTADFTLYAKWTGRRGDADCDDAVNAADAAAILRHLVRLTELTPQGLLNAKVTDGTGAVSAADAAKILRWLVRLEADL